MHCYKKKVNHTQIQNRIAKDIHRMYLDKIIMHSLVKEDSVIFPLIFVLLLLSSAFPLEEVFDKYFFERLILLIVTSTIFSFLPLFKLIIINVKLILLYYYY